jgi:hypothetical protein
MWIWMKRGPAPGILFEDDPAPTGGGGGGGATAARQVLSPDKAVATVNSLAQKLGGVQAAAQQLATENRKYRQRIKALEEAAGKADGELKQYKELGKFDELKKQVGEHATLKKKVEEADRRTHVSNVAQVAGIGAVSVLEDLHAKGMETVVQDQTVDGKAAKVAMARKAGENGASYVPLLQYVELNHKEYLPSLRVQATGDGQDSSAETASGRPFVQQGSSGGNAKKDPVTEFLNAQNKAREKERNPLMPQT